MTREKLRLRTIIFPLALVLVHVLVVSAVSGLYATAYPSVAAWLSPLTGQQPFAYATPEELILQEYPRIAVLYSLILIPVYSLLLLIRSMRNPQAVWLRRPAWPDLWQGLCLTVGLLGVTNLIFAGLTLLGERMPLIESLIQDYMAQAGAFSPAIGYGWLALGIAVLAPICEELLFRGLIQGELRRVMPEGFAVLVQALLFSAFHVQPIQVIYVFLPALALGAVYAWTRSLWVPIVMHIAFNALGSLLPALVQGDLALSQMVAVAEMAFIIVAVPATMAIALRARET